MAKEENPEMSKQQRDGEISSSDSQGAQMSTVGKYM